MLLVPLFLFYGFNVFLFTDFDGLWLFALEGDASDAVAGVQVERGAGGRARVHGGQC